MARHIMDRNPGSIGLATRSRSAKADFPVLPVSLQEYYTEQVNVHWPPWHR